jgi:serine protease Do
VGAEVRDNRREARLIWAKIGLRLHPVGAEEVQKAPLRGGLAIVEVRPDSPADRAGVLPGDVLVGLHKWEITTLDDVGWVLDHRDIKPFRPLRFYILRDGKVYKGWLDED